MLAVARVRRGRRVGLLTDALALPSFAYRFVTCLALGREFAGDDGVVRFQPTETGRGSLDASKAEVNVLAAEQSNSLLTIGDVAMLKIYRRISAGEHPEAEIGAISRRAASRMRPFSSEMWFALPLTAHFHLSDCTRVRAKRR